MFRFIFRHREHFEIVVVGAHMTGLPLNSQLLQLGGKLVRPCRTAPVYRMYSLGNKPMLLRSSAEAKGCSFEAEVWALPVENVGQFLMHIKSPLGIGDLLLEDGSQTIDDKRHCPALYMVEGYMGLVDNNGMCCLQQQVHEQVKGFLGEHFAVEDQKLPDISTFSGWRAYISQHNQSQEKPTTTS